MPVIRLQLQGNRTEKSIARCQGIRRLGNQSIDNRRADANKGNLIAEPSPSDRQRPTQGRPIHHRAIADGLLFHLILVLLAHFPIQFLE